MVMTLIALAVGMPLALELCGANNHLLPAMEGHRCAGIASALTHIETWLGFFGIVLAVLLLACAAAGGSTSPANARPFRGPPGALRRLWDTLQLLAQWQTARKAMALGLIPQRHPTIA